MLSLDSILTLISIYILTRESPSVNLTSEDQKLGALGSLQSKEVTRTREFHVLKMNGHE